MKEGPKGPKNEFGKVIDLKTRREIRSEGDVRAQQMESRKEESIMELDESGLRAARKKAEAIVTSTNYVDRSTLDAKRRKMDFLNIHKIGQMLLGATSKDVADMGAHYRAIALTFIEKDDNRNS